MIFKKIFSLRVLKRLLVERLSEPLHLNILAGLAWVFGSQKKKFFFDLIIREHNAYAILESANKAKDMGLKGISIVEFGVAAGAGLCNMVKIAEKVKKITGVHIEIYGFDSGEGLPEPDGHKDYSNSYVKGFYPMSTKQLKDILPGHAHLVLGDVKETVPKFMQSFSSKYPIAYIVQDLDYYTSTKHALEILKDPDPKKYLPLIHMYLDDIDYLEQSIFCGEELACSEFNQENIMRKIEKNRFLKHYRVFKNGKWLDKMMKVHVFDHPIYKEGRKNKQMCIITNPYIKGLNFSEHKEAKYLK
eukprot:COSAG01_NODE_165_length_23303_cov_269.524953_7_plen_302_part_00